MLAGRYKVTITEATVAPNNKGETQARVTFATDRGETITWYGGMASDKAFGYTVKQLTNAGWTSDDFADVGMIAGAEVEIVVEDDEYQGKTRQRVKYINGPRPVLDEETIAAFGAASVERVRAARAGKSEGGQIPASVAPAARDESPF